MGFGNLGASGGPGGGGGGASGGEVYLRPMFVPVAVPTEQDVGASDTGLGRAMYVGKAAAAWTAVQVSIDPVTASGASAFATNGWAEVGVYTGVPDTASASSVLTRRGSADISTIMDGTSQGLATVTVTGIAAGADVWIVIAARVDGAEQIPTIKGAVPVVAIDGSVLDFDSRPSTTASGTFSCNGSAGYMGFAATGEE